MLDTDHNGPTLLLLHALVSGGADPSETTIDKAIAGAALLAAKLEALESAPKPKREKKSKEPKETDATTPDADAPAPDA